MTNLFHRLFAGNRAAVGTEQGGCLRPATPTSGDQPIQNILYTTVEYLTFFHNHLTGDGPPIGVYPAWRQPDNGTTLEHTVTAWGCIDFDEGHHQSYMHAVNVANVLHLNHIRGWIEISRSKGFHVWVFPTAPVEAALMRRALQAACQLVDAPAREVNPKQTDLKPGQLGNYVRLPYPAGYGQQRRRCMVEGPDADSLEVVALNDFLEAAHQQLASRPQLQQLACLYKSARPPKPPVSVDSRAGVLPPLIEKMVAEGPITPGQDRSAWLWRLCRIMAEKEVPYGDAHDALRDADRRWGKFSERRDGDEMLDRMLAKAWGL